MKKYLLTIAVALMTAFAFTACSSDDDDDTPASPKDNAPKGVEAVDLGLSVKWANMNIGATTPEGYGDYFAWGETKPYYTAGHSQDDPCTNWEKDKEAGYTWASYFDTKDVGSTFETYAKDKDTKLKPEHDAAQANWKGKWRMPTREEINELRTKCSWIVTMIGFKVIGPNGNSIFLPAAGCRSYGSLDKAGTCGYYWSSSLCLIGSGAKGAYDLYFDSGYVGMNDGYNRTTGHSIRAVCD